MTDKKETRTPIATAKKDNNQLIFSLFGSHAGGILIAVVMCFSLTFLMGNTWGQLIVQVLVLLGYAFPIYSMMWTVGHRDFNKYSFGHIDRNIYKGFKLGALAAIPLVVFGIAFVIIAVSSFDWREYAGPIFRIINGHVWPTLNMIELTAGVNDYSWWQLTLFVVLPIIVLIGTSGMSYIMGNYDFSPLEKLMYKNKKKNDDKKKEKRKSYDTV